MKLWELDWKVGRMYKASNGQILEVDLMGNLVDYSLNPICISHKTLCSMDFEPYIDWSEIPIDTKVLVSENGFNWYKRYFSKYEDGKIYCFKYGANSWSIATDNEIISWEYTKLAESEI